MSFLSPWFLFGLLAAVAPILVHLIRRERPQTLPFSTLRFFPQTSRIASMLHRIKHWLLLAVRITIVALLALAFARPFFDPDVSRELNMAPGATVVLLDRSMSMGVEDRFAEALDEVAGLIDEMVAGELMAVVEFAGGTGSVQEFTSDTAQLRRFLRAIEAPGYDGTRYQPALAFAAEMMRSVPSYERRIVLVSDMQATGLTGVDPEWRLDEGVRFESRSVGSEDPAENLAVVEVRSPQRVVRENEEHEIEARIVNRSPLPGLDATVALIVDDGTVATATVDVAANSEKTVKFKTGLTQGAHRGVVQLGPDSLAGDNRFYFTVDVAERTRVLVVNGEPSGRWSDDEAYWFGLATGGDSPAFVVDTREAPALGAIDLSTYEVVVLLNAGDLRTRHYAMLESFVAAGGSLLIAPGDRVDPASFNQGLAAVLPAKLAGSFVAMTDDYRILSRVDPRHPLLAGLGGNNAVWNARIRAFWPLQSTDAGRALMWFDDGSPALMERRLAKGSVLLVTTALDAEWNDLPMQGMYLPFIHESLRYLTARKEKRRYYMAGEALALPVTSGELTITLPNGQTLVWPADTPYTTTTGQEPGFYLLAGEETAAHFAVNAITDESDLDRFDGRQLAERVIHVATDEASDPDVLLAAAASESETTQRIWWWLLLLVFILTSAELILANRTHR